MKIFGSKASKRNKKDKKKKKDVSVYTPYDGDPDYHLTDVQVTGKDGKKTKGKDKKMSKKSIALLIVAIVAFLLAGAAFAAVQFIKPPEIKVHENDKTIVDTENGDAVTVDPGERISDYFTFLVCATDIDETRTDNMMVVGFDTKNHKVNVLNIPRDVMCDNDRTGASRKINAAYGSHQDIENTLKEVKKVIGFTPDKYIVVNFDGIAQIVDAIGGIDYNVPFKMIYNDPVQDLNIYFEPGMQHMNGEQVVEFLRWRHNDPGYTYLQTEGYDGGDESRIQKQQEFLKYLAEQILKPENILKAKPIAEAVFNNVRTDLTLGEIVWMANQAMQVDSDNIQMFTLPGYAASSYAGSDAYLSFFFPNEAETLEMINTYFNPYDKEITSLDVIESPPDGERRHDTSSDEDESDYYDYSGEEEADEEESSHSSSSSSSNEDRYDDEDSSDEDSGSSSGSSSSSSSDSDSSSDDSSQSSDQSSDSSSSDTSSDSSGSSADTDTGSDASSSSQSAPEAPAAGDPEA